MRAWIFRSDLVFVSLLFIFSVYFYVNSNYLVEQQRSGSKRQINSVTVPFEQPPAPDDLNPELNIENLLSDTGADNEKQLKPKFVILVASLPRSGSTLISELLQTRSDTVLFYEPDHKTEFTTCATVPNCISDYIRSILTCTFSAEFETWQRNKFFSYFHQVVRDCKHTNCKKLIDLRGMCNDADFTITKLIRVPLGFLEGLLSNSSVDARIIHLIRDPRGSLISNKKMGWISDPLLRCTKVYDDQLSYDYLSEKYPDKIMQVQYEKFCLDPGKTTEKMFHFAYDDQTLSKKTIDHLKNHTEVKTVALGPMNTIRKSSDQYQEWRWKIQENFLISIEKEKICKKSIEKLQYRIFNTIGNVKNSNISLFTETSL